MECQVTWEMSVATKGCDVTGAKKLPPKFNWAVLRVPDCSTAYFTITSRYSVMSQYSVLTKP
jgi:hypothetical protein